MLFDETEMLEVCKKYGIDIVEKTGWPLYKDNEMDDDFSMYDIMRDTCNIVVDVKTLYSKSLKINTCIDYEAKQFCNYFSDELQQPKSITVSNSPEVQCIQSSIPNENINNIAA